MTTIINPQLDGQPFIWHGGPVGVLLSHGFGASTAEIRPVARLLHSHGLTVSGPLLPGHLTSIHAINRCHWQDWVGAYQNAFLELTEYCDAVFVGGESMGGLLALYQAALAGQMPEAQKLRLIKGVITYAPIIKHRSRLAPLVSSCLALVKDSINKPQSISSPTLADWQGYSVYPIPAARQLFLLQSTVKRKLKYIKVPILTIQGDQDRSVDSDSPAILRRLATSTSVEIHWLEKAGHCIALEDQRELVAQITLKFISKQL